MSDIRHILFLAPEGDTDLNLVFVFKKNSIKFLKTAHFENKKELGGVGIAIYIYFFFNAAKS